MTRIYIVFLISLSFTTHLTAHKTSKKALCIDGFKDWKVLSKGNISHNGDYVSYELSPQKGDGDLIIYDGNHPDTIPRGYAAAFGAASDFVVFRIKQPEQLIRKAKKDKVKKGEMPKDSLGVFVFRNKKIYKFPRLKSYKIPDEGASCWVAFLAEAERDTAQNGDKPENKKDGTGGDLILFNPQNGDTLLFKNVTEYFYPKQGGAVYFTAQAKDSARTISEVFVFDPENGTSHKLFSTEGWIKKLVSDETGGQYAFLMSCDTIDEKVYSLYLGDGLNQPSKIVDKYTSGVPVGWSPSENGRVYFSRDGSKLYLGVAESPVPKPEDTLPEEDSPKLDVWNWKDNKLQPQQKVEAEKEKKRTFLGVYHVALNRYIQLADIKIKQVRTIQKGNGDVGLGMDDSPYIRASGWTGGDLKDYYLIDLKSGIKIKVLTGKSWARLSPQGKYILWYEPADSSYYATSTEQDFMDTVSLTKILPVAFYDEQNDRPMEPNPYGIAGWSQGDRFVYIYDRYDIWKIDPLGERVPVNITKAFGRRNNTRLRYVKLDKDLEYIPLTEPVLLRAVDERTMSQGFFSMHFNSSKDIDYVVMDRYIFADLKKAKKANKILYTKQDVKSYPDLWTSSLEFKHSKKISEANPQQEKYNWAAVDLVKWTSFSGEELKGLLYKPEDLDPTQKYPMIVYFYERNSELLNRYYLPSPSRSVINKTFYASNGYLVFIPDITYKTGYPGQSAYNAIVSGTQYLIQEYNFVDKDRIGLQGQSWGGYQTAYLVTQTDMFSAAMAGAPVSNMTSAYGGIRWSSGKSRMFQYEHTQSRIGGTLWDKPLFYIENSPLFYAPKINTPLLMMHNDKDGAVPWYQGIELFVAMRRLDKPAWLLSYNEEPHNLKAGSWANRIDLSKRMFQFFNHYLKGEPSPAWMEKGVPATEKGEELGY